MSHAFVSNGKIEEGVVNKSEITESTIDMDGGIITSHATPIQDTDVVNKAYIDIKIVAFTITITGDRVSTSITLPPSVAILVGDLTLSVRSTVANGPCARFSICKSHQGIPGVIYRSASSPGLGTTETLEMEWQAGNNPEILKTGANYDGVYQIVAILNT